MFKLRDQHIEAFLRTHDEDLVVQIAGDVRQQFPDTAGKLTDQELYRRVYRGIARARRYGLRKRETLGLFVSVQFKVAPSFDEHIRINRYLREETILPERRLDYALTAASERDWAEAAQMADPRAWA